MSVEIVSMIGAVTGAISGVAAVIFGWGTSEWSKHRAALRHSRCPLAATILLLAGSVDAQDRNLFAVEPDAQQRLVRLDHNLLGTARVNADTNEPAVLRLNLFDDVALDGIVEHTGPTRAGYWLSGRIHGQPLSSLTLVVNRNVVAGEIRVVGATYTIRSVGDGVHTVRRLDPGLPFDDDSLQLPEPPHGGTAGARPIRPPAPSAIRSAQDPPPEDGSRIDVMAVYTPAARDKEGGRADIEALIDLNVASTNGALRDSGVLTRINLLLATETDYDETDAGDHVEIVNHLRNPEDGRMDEVHVIRDQYAADTIVLYAHAASLGVGGSAQGGVNWGRRDRYAAFWINLRGSDTSYTFTHELGHNLGMEHDRYQENKHPIESYGDISRYPVPYGFGYVNQRAFDAGALASSRWTTIMAYDAQCSDSGFRCTRLHRFSDPDQTRLGEPMGVPGSEPSLSITGPADGRRTLNEMRHVLANFRAAPCLRDGMRIRLQASNGQYVVAVGNGGGNVLAVGSHLGPWGEFTLVDTNGGCVESGDVVSVHTSDGFFVRAAQGGGSTLDATDPQATPWAQFVARRHRGGGAIRNLDFATIQVASGHYVCAEEGGGGVVRADCDSPGGWGKFKVSATDATSSNRNWLMGGQRLLAGQSIQAEGAACRLVFQTDGNLVAYHEGVAYWHSRTAVTASGGSAVMQSDGNFVVYDAAAVARWSTGTAGNPGAFLVIERNCNVVLLAAGGAQLWFSGQP